MRVRQLTCSHGPFEADALEHAVLHDGVYDTCATGQTISAQSQKIARADRIERTADRAAGGEKAERGCPTSLEPMRHGRGGRQERDARREAAREALREKDLPVLGRVGETKHPRGVEAECGA